MKKIIFSGILVLGIFLNCEKISKESPIDQKNVKTVNTEKQVFLPPFKTWIKLTKQKGKEVIFNPCDAENKKLIVTNEKIKEHVGHEELIHKIKSIVSEGKTFKFIMENDAIFIFKYIDTTKGIWSSENSYFNGSYKTIDSTYSDRVITIEQPCRECWGDECDNM